MGVIHDVFLRISLYRPYTENKQVDLEMERFQIWAFFALFIVTAPATVDYRRTVIKPGFGVNFDRVGHIITTGGMTQFLKTWVIKIPTFTYEAMPMFDCANATNWASRCTSINKLIQKYNSIVYEQVSMAKKMVMSANSLIPANDTRDEARSKRDTSIDMPKWLKPDPLEAVMDNLPTHWTGQIWADLLHKPGPRAKRRLREHLRHVSRAMYWNKRGIQQLNDDISAFSVLEFNQTKLLEKGMEGINDRLNQVITNMQQTYAKFRLIDEHLLARIQFGVELNTKLFGDVMTTVCEYLQHGMGIYQSALRWREGIQSVVKGFLSPDLVTVTDIAEIIDHVQTHVLSKPRYSDLSLMDASPMFYYQMRDLTYMRDDQAIYISMSIPLYRTAGLLPVYRVDVYDVPIASGTIQPQPNIHKANDPSEESYTRIHNLPDFLAISEDHQAYVEMHKTLFHTCRGKSTVYVCGPGMSALKKPSVKSCAFAVFTEDKAAALKACDVRFETGDKWRPYGSAIQIAADHTFLMHKSNRDGPRDTWHLQCPESPSQPQTTLTPCNMCRLKIPCSCTVTARDFFLPRRYTGCAGWDETGSTEVTYAYHLNTFAVSTLYPTSSEARVNSYEAKLNAKWPPLKYPNITFFHEDKWNQYVELSEKYRANYTALIETRNKDKVVYIDKVDAELARTRNFSDQVAYRESSLLRGVKDVIIGVFGDNVFNVIAFVFGPMGIACLSFLLSLADFIRNVVGTVQCLCRQMKAAQQYSYLVSN